MQDGIYDMSASDLLTRPFTSIGGLFGRLQVFVIPGDTPFLLPWEGQC